MKATIETTCAYCGKPFMAKRADRMYCSDTCKQMAYFKRSGKSLSGVLIKKDLEQVKPQSNETDLPETYTYIQSRFEKLIGKAFLEDDDSIKLEDPCKYWATQAVLSIQWVNKRLRCLLESVIRLSNYAAIDQYTLDCVKDAVGRMQRSRTFKSLPDDYPFTQIIQELTALVQQAPINKRNGLLRFRLILEQKARFVYTRNVLKKITSPIKFSELHFNE